MDVNNLDDLFLYPIDQLLESSDYKRPASVDLHNTRKKAFMQRFIYNTLAIEGNHLRPDEIVSIAQNSEDRHFRVRADFEADHLEVHGMMDVLDHVRAKKYSQDDLAKFTVSVGF